MKKHVVFLELYNVFFCSIPCMRLAGERIEDEIKCVP